MMDLMYVKCANKCHLKFPHIGDIVVYIKFNIIGNLFMAYIYWLI